MASQKDIFEPNFFAANTFASGIFRGGVLESNDTGTTPVSGTPARQLTAMASFAGPATHPRSATAARK